jgi:hypothetical protein
VKKLQRKDITIKTEEVGINPVYVQQVQVLYGSVGEFPVSKVATVFTLFKMTIIIYTP